MSNETKRQWPPRISEDPRYKDKKTTHQLAISTRECFVSRGYMMCKELGFHGIKRPIPADESYITALDMGEPGRIFGATSGEKSHVFAYFRKAAEDIIVDLGVIEGAKDLRNSLVAVSGSTAYVATSPAPGRIVRCTLGNLWNDCVQEWGIEPAKFEALAVPLPDEGIACLVGDKKRGVLYGLGEKTGTFFSVNIESKEVKIIGPVDEVQHFSRNLIVTDEGDVYGAGALGRLFCYRPEEDKLEHLDVSIPASAGRKMYARVDAWTYDATKDIIYGGTEADGILFAFNLFEKKMRSLGKPTGDARIRSIAVGNDGIVYGTAGERGDIGRMFAYDPKAGTLEDMGIPLATVEIRRYGYEFDAALAGPEGEIYLGESDRGGCLFVYFPPIKKQAKLYDEMPF